MATFEAEKVEMAFPKPMETIPALSWISGKIHQILLQDKEQYYVVVLTDAHGSSQARFGDPYTGKPLPLSADNPMYALLQQAYFAEKTVHLGVRDFGYDPQSGSEKIIIDRVSVYS